MPLLDVFWTMLVFFLWIAWLMLLVRVFADIFGTDKSGWWKAAWSIFVLVLPLMGTFVYLIANGSNMARHEAEHAREFEREQQNYIRSVAGTGSVSEELHKLAELQSRGVITAEEFAGQKAKLLA